ncbi:MAG: hypothetical protein GDA37_09295 [Ekhidna sp.]|nr:hypothetical protein [Ekhidna sp.]
MRGVVMMMPMMMIRIFALYADNDTPTGIWSDGTTLWVADYNDYKLFAYRLADRMRQTSKEFDKHADNQDPIGI